MAVQTTVVSSSLVEILDRILDKGIVIDAWVSVSVIGIELITVEARVIVASVETYAKYARLLKEIGPVAKGTRHTRTLGENLQELESGVGGLPVAGSLLGGNEQEKVAMPAGNTKSARKTTRSKRGRSKAKK